MILIEDKCDKSTDSNKEFKSMALFGRRTECSAVPLTSKY